VYECPFLVVNSIYTLFFAASFISSSDINPGCARISTHASMAALFVFSFTGSTIVSPCTRTISAPLILAFSVNLFISFGRICVNSTPIITLKSLLYLLKASLNCN